MINIDAQQEAALLNKSSNFLIVLEEVQERERIVGKTQFYKLLKSIFRCFNNDLTRSLGNILGTSQAGLANKDISDKLKEKLVRPILLSCKLIKYILHNLRDFNDLVGERFKLQVSETSIPKVAEDSVILFRATSDKKISFKVVINEEVPIVILTDQRRLVQIIITLLSNANKHTTAGSLTFRIFHPKVGDIFLRSHLRFQVEDTGEGMESSIQARLSKLFNSGISYQDFKQISTFGFNLFICNILAKKLFYPENKDQQDPLILDDSDASGIKFTSKPGFGSIFYFDIRLFEEKKPERLQDSIFNYLVVSQAQSAHQKPRREDFTSFKGNQNLIRSNIFISNSIPSLNHQAQLSKSQADRFLNDHQQEKEDNQQNKKYNRFNDNTDQSRSKFKPAIKPGDTFKEEENAMEIPEEEDDIDGREKQETRTMVFQSRPQGMHSDYKYLRCECKNVLIIDRVQTSLDTFDMVLQTFHFHPQKCRSLQEAIATAQHKYQNSCSICNQRMFICIFISIDEFLKQDVLQTFPTELESFMYSSACSDSVIIIISSSDTPAKKLNDNQRIDDFLSSTFDSIELQNLISKWKLLPPQDYFTQTNNQIQSHVIPLSPS